VVNLESWRETITTGRVFAARPRSASQTSPGRGLIDEVQNLLLHGPRPQQVKSVLVGKIDNLRQGLAYLGSRLRTPLPQPRVEYFKQSVHFVRLQFTLIRAAGPPATSLRAIVSWKRMNGETRTRIDEIVSVDPHLMHGAPCFRGTRVPVRLLLDDLSTGFTIDDFLEACPTVTREQVERYLELPLPS